MKAIVLAYFEARNAGDTSKARSMFSDDATIEDPFGAPLKTADQFFGGLGGAIKPHFTILVITGTNSTTAAAALTIKYGNVSMNAIELFTFKPDGKISSMKAYWGSEDRKSGP